MDELKGREPVRAIVPASRPLDDPTDGGRSPQAKITLPGGKTVTRRVAAQRYKRALLGLRDHFDTISVCNACSGLKLSVKWELGILKELAEDKKNPALRMQALNFIRLIKAAAVHDVGPMGQTYKNLGRMADIQGQASMDALENVQREARRATEGKEITHTSITVEAKLIEPDLEEDRESPL